MTANIAKDDIGPAREAHSHFETKQDNYADRENSCCGDKYYSRNKPWISS